MASGVEQLNALRDLMGPQLEVGVIDDSRTLVLPLDRDASVQAGSAGTYREVVVQWGGRIVAHRRFSHVNMAPGDKLSICFCDQIANLIYDMIERGELTKGEG